MNTKEWFWWDCIDMKPKTGRPSNITINVKVIVCKMDKETAENALVRALQVPQHRKYN